MNSVDFFFFLANQLSQQTKIIVVAGSLTTIFFKNFNFVPSSTTRRKRKVPPRHTFRFPFFLFPLSLSLSFSSRVPTRLFAAINQPPCACTPAHILSECYSRMRFRLCNQLRLRGRTIVPSFTFTSRGFVSFVLETHSSRQKRIAFTVP